MKPGVGVADMARIDLAHTADFRIGSLRIVPAMRQIVRDDGATEILEPRVMQVLVALALADGAILTRDDLTRTCWEGRVVGEDAINRVISRLRRVADGIGRDIVLLETITKVGYRFIPADSADSTEPRGGTAASALPIRVAPSRGIVPSVTPRSVSAARPIWGWPPRRQWLAAGAAVAGLSLLVGVTALRKSAVDGTTLVRVEALVAAPDDKEATAVGAGLRAAVERHLAGSETPIEIVDNGAPGATKGPLIIRGNTMNDRGTLRANVEFVSGQSGAVIWADKFDRPVAEFDQFEDQVGIQIARELHCAYANGRGPYFNHDAELARLSLAHCDAIAGDFDDAVRIDAQITRRAPGFARGWAEYAVDTAIGGEDLPTTLNAAANARARAYAQRALALNPHEGLAYAAIMRTLDGLPQWIDRERVTARGFAADPSEPMIHSFRYDTLSEVGRLQEALNEERLTFEHEHFFQPTIRRLIDAEVNLGDIGRARDYAAMGQRYWPHYSSIQHAALGLELRIGNPVEALKLLNAGAAEDQQNTTGFMRAFLMWRIAPSPATNAAAVRTIEAAARQDGVNNEQVQLLVKLGHVDAAYRLAERIPTSVSPDPIWFAGDLAPFRADPRFMAFAARLGLTRIWQQTGKWPDFCRDQHLPYDCQAAARAALQVAHPAPR